MFYRSFVNLGHNLLAMECFQLIHFRHNVHFDVKLNDLKSKGLKGL